MFDYDLEKAKEELRKIPIMDLIKQYEISDVADLFDGIEEYCFNNDISAVFLDNLSYYDMARFLSKEYPLMVQEYVGYHIQESRDGHGGCFVTYN